MTLPNQKNKIYSVILTVPNALYVRCTCALQVYKPSKRQSCKKTLYQAGVLQIKTVSDASLLQVCACVPNCNKKGLVVLYTMEVTGLFCHLLNCSSKF
jgi:hypothetical protein